MDNRLAESHPFLNYALLFLRWTFVITYSNVLNQIAGILFLWQVEWDKRGSEK
jgi:hypothetical protein